MVKKKKSSVKATRNSKASLRASASLAKAQYEGGDDAAALTFKDSGEGDGSYRLTLMMKCFPDGQGGWICT